MDRAYPDKIDPRPRRRRNQDNPYRIFSVGIETTVPHFYLAFTDGCGVQHCIEIDRPLFDAFDQFELEDISQMHKIDRHCERSEQSEGSLHTRAIYEPEDVEEVVFHQLNMEALHREISNLPETQCRRLTLYYFDGLTYSEIAEREGCKRQAVQESIHAALKKLKKFLT